MVLGRLTIYLEAQDVSINSQLKMSYEGNMLIIVWNKECKCKIIIRLFK